jgi:hypothetical protein
MQGLALAVDTGPGAASRLKSTHPLEEIMKLADRLPSDFIRMMGMLCAMVALAGCNGSSINLGGAPSVVLVAPWQP